MPSLISVRSLRAGILTLAVGVTAILFDGCSTGPIGDVSSLLAGIPAASLAPAESAARAGDAVGAAERYLALAKQSPSPAREALELRAAEAYYQAGKSGLGLRTLSGIANDRLPPAGRNVRHLLGARIALQAGLPERAVAELSKLGAMGLPSNTRREVLGLKAAAYRQSGDSVQAAKTLIELDSLARTPSERLANQVSVVMTLAFLEIGQLREVATKGPGRVRDWAELTLLLSRHADADAGMLADFTQWRNARQGLKVTDDLPRAYYAALAGDYAAGSRVFMLLPQNGRYSGAGGAIQGGINQADNLNRNGTRPLLKSADSAFDAAAAYQTAITAGANLVIGPLQKGAVDALSMNQQMPSTTLALNYNTNGRSLPKGLFQFALAPESEALSAANHAWASGLRQALILYPQGPWGNRLAGAFREHWRTLGGALSGEAVFGDTEASMGLAVENLLAPGKGDLIFLAATNADAKIIWRHLKAANVRGLPAIATSHVFSGAAADAAALNGLYFVDMPWLLSRGSLPAAVERLRPVNATESAPLMRLQAMGVDSYRLAPLVDSAASTPGWFFFGASGGLSVDGTGRMQRELILIRFGANGASPVERIDRTASKRGSSRAGQSGATSR